MFKPKKTVGHKPIIYDLPDLTDFRLITLSDLKDIINECEWTQHDKIFRIYDGDTCIYVITIDDIKSISHSYNIRLFHAIYEYLGIEVVIKAENL